MHHISELEIDDPRLREIFSYCRPPRTPRYGLGYIEQIDAIIPSCRFENSLATGLQKPSVPDMHKFFSLVNVCHGRRVNIEWIKRMLNWDLFTHPQDKEFNATTFAELKKDLSEQWQTYMTIKICGYPFMNGTDFPKRK